MRGASSALTGVSDLPGRLAVGLIVLASSYSELVQRPAPHCSRGASLTQQGRVSLQVPRCALESFWGVRYQYRGGSRRK